MASAPYVYEANKEVVNGTKTRAGRTWDTSYKLCGRGTAARCFGLSVLVSCELPRAPLSWFSLVSPLPERLRTHKLTLRCPSSTLLGGERTSLDGRRKRRWKGRGRGGDDEEDEPALVVGDDPAAAAAAAGMVNGRERKSGVQDQDKESKERETKEWLLHMFLPVVGYYSLPSSFCVMKLGCFALPVSEHAVILQ